MGVAVLQPRDYLTDPFSSRNIIPSQQRQKKPTPNRRRRSPPRHKPATSPPSPETSFIPNGSKKSINHHNNNNNNNNNVRILKRGEEITPDLTVEKPDLRSTRRIGSDPVQIPTQNRVSDRKSTPASFYAGPVTSTSPPPSEVPVPAFFAKKSVSVFKPSDATNHLIRILRLDIA